MSNLIAKHNFQTQDWSVIENDLNSSYVDLCIGFIDQESVINFKGLKFGFNLISNDVILDIQSYPPEGITFLQSDQEYLTIYRLNLQPETTYSLFFWLENDEKRSEYTYNFTTPRPPQPFLSWTWNGQVWEAPIPYPQDNEFYIWNEQTQQWEKPPEV